MRKIIDKDINLKNIDLVLEEIKENFLYTNKNQIGLNKAKIELFEKLLAKTLENSKLRNKVKYSLLDLDFKEIIFNKNNFNSLITLFYNLRIKYKENLEFIIYLEDIFFDMILHQFKEIDKFSPELNTSALYLKEGLLLEHIDKFKREKTNRKWIESYSRLLNIKIESIKTLLLFILKYDCNERKKYKYFENQLQVYYSILQFYDHFNSEFDTFEGDYNKYLDLKNREEKSEDDIKTLEIIEFKDKIIKQSKEDLENGKLELMFKIFLYIDRNELSEDFFDFIKILKDNKNYYNQINMNFENRFIFENKDYKYNGFSEIRPIKYNKYRLLIEFDNYLKEKELNLNLYEKEMFIEKNGYSMKNCLDEFSIKFVKKYFNDVNEKDIDKFKKNIKEKITKIEKKIKNTETNYIISESIEKYNYEKEFIEKIKKNWDYFQNILKSIFEYKSIDKSEFGKSGIGIFQLFSKKWFLESFDKNISLSRDFAKDWANSQIKRKEVKIIQEISNLYDKSKDKEVFTNNLYKDLKKLVKKNKEYVLFKSIDFDIYNFPSIEWLQGDEKKYITAKVKIDNSIIYILESNQQRESLLFEKGDFILEQSKSGYDNYKDELFVKIEDEFKENEINEIIQSNKNPFNTREDVLQNVKIRIMEKFRLKRKSKAKLYKFFKK